MYPELIMYVPTKGRPEQAKRLEKQFYSTATAHSKIQFILSEDDNRYSDYLEIDWIDKPISILPDKPGFVDPLNKGYAKDKNSSFAVGFMGDDHFPRTIGWDQMFIEELHDLQTGFVYGNDGLQGEAIPTQIAMTSDIAETLGFMTLPQLWHLYADNFWLDLGKAINRIKYLPGVYLEHMHPAIGKANSDAGYEFSGASTLNSRDKAEYKRYLENDLHKHAQNLLSMIQRTGKL